MSQDDLSEVQTLENKVARNYQLFNFMCMFSINNIIYTVVYFLQFF